MSSLCCVRHTDGTPIPHVDGILVLPLADYFIHLRHSPMKQRKGRRTSITVDNQYDHLKMWWDYCADVGVSYDQVNYMEHFEGFRQGKLRSHGGSVSNDSFNTYYSTIRAFYEWCSKNGYPNLMEFPPVESSACYVENDTDHIVGRGRLVDRLMDPGKEVVAKVNDYKDKFLTDDRYRQLSKALRAIDPVYEYIAFMMLTTALRIGGVLQLPLGANRLNPQWLRLPDWQGSQKFQDFFYINKGQKVIRKCIVLREAMEVLHSEYILGYRKDYAKRYKARFGSGETAPLWLNKNGKPVYNTDVWCAFREASKVCGFYVCPHHLRHTYATHVVHNYFVANGLKPNLAYAHDIKVALSEQLGHASIETIRIYIRTVIRVYAEAWLPVLTPGLQKQVDETLPSVVLATANHFFKRGSHQ
ncbi:TPA: site-specific integrase [Pseudomonas aeruginosa]|nr:site-specific integrase [Pseudomonas aeruginosa]